MHLTVPELREVTIVLSSPTTLTALGRLTEADVADLQGVTVEHVRRERYKGIGPAYEKVGRRIIYRREDVEAWLARHRIDPEAV